MKVINLLLEVKEKIKSIDNLGVSCISKLVLRITLKTVKVM